MQEDKKQDCEVPAAADRPQGGCCDSSTDRVDCCSGSQSAANEGCSAPVDAADCCSAPGPAQVRKAGFCLYPFVTGWLDTAVGQVPQISTRLDWADRRGRWAVRWGIGRNHYSVTPGLYAVGQPDGDSPLLMSANYKLSFDCLRSALAGESAWILVIDTRGINVWCAAGKGTFGTDEIIRSCRRAQLTELLNHRDMIVPQLGAPGVAAFKVKRDTGFQVRYGPVRAADLKAFFAAGMQATAAMRQVTFSCWERLILTPVEVMILRNKLLIAMLVLFVLGGVGPEVFSLPAAWHRGLAATCAVLVGILSGCVLTPVLLPWIPGRAFAVKGALLGMVATPFLILGPYREVGISGWVCLWLMVMAVASYTAMNFTGSTTFTSPSGVAREMRYALPSQALAAIVAGLLWLGSAFN